MSILTRPARAAVIAVLGLALCGAGAGIASADIPAPAPGTQACTNAVNANSRVVHAKAALDAAEAQQQSLTGQLADARVATTVVQATVDLLTGQLSSQTATVAQAQHAYDEAVARATRELCTGHSADSRHRTTPAKDCGCATTPAPVTTEPTSTVIEQPPATPLVITYKTVSPTQDDNSTATTSGNEVTTVPKGSASTGAV